MMRQNLGRAESISHAEYHILECLVNEVDLSELKRRMGSDVHAIKRFDKAAANVVGLVVNIMDRRRHKLPKDHVDYKVKR